MFRKYLTLLIICFISYYANAQSQSLESYIHQGLQNSPLLKDYQNQLQSSTIDSVILNAQRKPQLNAIGQLLVAPTYNGYGYDGAVTNTGNYVAQVSASQNILVKKIYAPQYEAIRIEKQSITNTSRISEHDLKKGIIDQYLTAYSSLNQLTFIQSAYELMKNEEMILQKFVQQGIYKQTDYLSFEIAVQSEEIQIKQLKNQYRTDLRQLNFICGINDTTNYTLPAPQLQTQIKVEKNNSFFLMQFKIDSIKINNQRSFVDVNYRPKLNWFVDAGILGSNPALLYKNLGTSFGFNFSMPLYDGKQKKLQYQKISINESIRTNYQNFYRNQFDQHIQQIKMDMTDNEQLIAQIQKQLEPSEILIDSSKQLLNKGELSVTDFIITIKNYIDVKSQLNQSQFKKLQLTNELNYWNW